MSGDKVLLLFFIIFDLLVISSFAADHDESSDISYELLPFVKVYKNGSVERFIDTEIVPPSLNPRSKVLSKDIIIQPTDPNNISARLYLPTAVATASAARKLPLLVYFHGGAYLTGSPFAPGHHNYLKALVAKANVVALSVNYRLAPEHPLPIGAYEDGLLALKWVFSHRKNGNGNGNETWIRSYVDFKRVFIGGDSAGGDIAHNVAMRVGLEKPEGIKVHGMFLNCPSFWGEARIGKETSFPDEWLDLIGRVWTHAYPNSTGNDDPALNPALDPNLRRLGCKKVLVYVAGNDVFCDRGILYKNALKESKWKGAVKVVKVKEQPHVFDLIYPKLKPAKEMKKQVAMFLNDRMRMGEKNKKNKKKNKNKNKKKHHRS